MAAVSPLTALSITCLDAPIVAITWQWLIGQTFRAGISISDRAVLFITAWLIYLVDRFADSLTVPASAPVSPRQRFCAEHRRRRAVLIILLALLDGFIGFTYLSRATVVNGAVIGVAIAVYLAINHFAPFVWRKLPVKEALIGFLFALGTVAAIHRTDVSFVVATLLFGTLCSLNCLSISIWEREIDIAQSRESFATARAGAIWVPAVACWVLAVVALSIAILGHVPAICICVATSAVLLALLHRAEFLSPDTRVAAADLVLLTPLVFLLIHLPA